MTARVLLAGWLLFGCAAFVEAGPAVGTQPIAWVLIHYADRLNPVTHAMATAAAEKVTAFYAAASYGTLQLEIDVYGPVTVAQPSGYCLGFAVPQAEAQLAASLGAYERRLFVVPPSPQCPWGGTTAMGLIPTRAFLNGSVGSWITIHETGHQLGMLHADSLLCQNHASLCTPGVRQDRGDRWDVMGNGTAQRHPSAAQKAQLGWFEPIDATPGVYTLTGFEQTPSALRIHRTGFDEDLLVEYRAAPLKKVLVHLQRRGTGPFLVLTFPASYRLIPGKVWTDPQTGQTLLVEALTDTTARVRVGP